MSDGGKGGSGRGGFSCHALKRYPITQDATVARTPKAFLVVHVQVSVSTFMHWCNAYRNLTNGADLET
jgi:hypothetical protein